MPVTGDPATAFLLHSGELGHLVDVRDLCLTAFDGLRDQPVDADSYIERISDSCGVHLAVLVKLFAVTAVANGWTRQDLADLFDMAEQASVDSGGG